MKGVTRCEDVAKLLRPWRDDVIEEPRVCGHGAGNSGKTSKVIGVLHNN